jgi:pilus assembly protein FimV
LLFVELRPVDREPIPLEADVDSEPTLLLVVLRPVDSEVTPLDAEVESDVT